MKNLFIKISLILVIVLGVFATSKVFTPTNAEAWYNNSTDHAWATPNPNGWSTCTPKNDCGPEGTQSQRVSCIHKDGSNVDCHTQNNVLRYADKVRHDNEWKCPEDDSAYTSTDNTKKCSKSVNVGADTNVLSRDCTLTDFKACEVQCPENSTPDSDSICTCNPGYHKIAGKDLVCEADSTPVPTASPSNPGGPGDGKSDNQGCSTHDCSNQSTGGQVLGASTGPMKAVLGLSTTSGEESALPLLQLLGAFGLSLTGFKFFKKNA